MRKIMALPQGKDFQGPVQVDAAFTLSASEAARMQEFLIVELAYKRRGRLDHKDVDDALCFALGLEVHTHEKRGNDVNYSSPDGRRIGFENKTQGLKCVTSIKEKCGKSFISPALFRANRPIKNLGDFLAVHNAWVQGRRTEASKGGEVDGEAVRLVEGIFVYDYVNLLSCFYFTQPLVELSEDLTRGWVMKNSADTLDVLDEKKVVRYSIPHNANIAGLKIQKHYLVPEIGAANLHHFALQAREVEAGYIDLFLPSRLADRLHEAGKGVVVTPDSEEVRTVRISRSAYDLLMEGEAKKQEPSNLVAVSVKRLLDDLSVSLPVMRISSPDQHVGGQLGALLKRVKAIEVDLKEGVKDRGSDFEL